MLTFLTRIGLGALVLGGALLYISPAQARDPLPFEAFAMDPAISSARVSPNGRWLAVIQRASVDGDPFLGIYDTRNLERGRIRTLGGRAMQVFSANWVNDDYLLVRFRQQLDDGEDTRQVSKVATVRRDRGGFTEIPRLQRDRRREGMGGEMLDNYSGVGIVSSLPADPDHVMVSYVDDAVTGVRTLAKVRADSGVIVSSVTANTRYRNFGVDFDGDVRTSTSFDTTTGQTIVNARVKGSSEWIEIGRSGAGEDAVSTTFLTLGFLDPDRPNELIVASNHDADTAGIYAYNIATRRYSELLFRHPDYDASGIEIVQDPEDRRRSFVTGFSFDGAGGEKVWIDPQFEALHENIDALLPGAINEIESMSHDEQVMVVRSEGPRNPATYYLLDLNEGGLQLIAESMPLLPAEELADVEFVEYTARDGTKIPALVTIPNGRGPFPAVVMPHGGPTARDFYGFDLWAQMFANHGYVVIQPQFRVSTGFGKAHLEAGFGEWGLVQQDDIDDSGRYLVQRGLARANNIAIMGWSYGGYASFVGAARDPNPYVCAIPGAGVADMAQFRAWLYDSNTRSPLSQYRNTVQGLNPLEMVNSVDVPVLVIHGDLDERVPISHSNSYVAALERAGKQHDYLVLEGANHFFGTIYYRHWMEMFPAMINWLDDTCAMKSR